MKPLSLLLPALAGLLLGAVAPDAGAQTSSPPAAPAASLFPSDDDLNVMMRYLVEDGATPGIVLGILEPDGSTRILHHGSAGEGVRPLSSRTVFEIGSINKTFTGAILADMVAKGEVALDDPVQKYLPDSVRVPSRNGRQITLLDLATHRSGLPRMPSNFVPAATGNPYATYDLAVIYAFLNGHELRRDIGAEFEYSNLGFGLLGHALSRAAGKEYRELVRERILEPLGMRNTSYHREGEVGAWHAQGYTDGGEAAPFWDAGEAIAGAGGLRSSVEDMLLYLRAQLGPADTELERAMRVAHQVHHRHPNNVNSGLAWRTMNEDGRTVVMHGGGTGGFSTMIAFDPERRTGFVMLTNTGSFEDDLAMDFLVRGAPLSLPEARVSREVLARYAGEYEMGAAPARPAFVRLEEDGTMTLRVGGNVRFRMHADSDTSFHLKRAPWRVAFTRDASGAVTGMTLDMGGATRTARRISDRALTPAEEKAAIRDLPLSAEEMARYEGTYPLRMGERTLELRVYAEDGKLMAQPAGQRSTRLRAQGGHVFIPDVDDEILLSFTVQDGRAVSATLRQSGREITGQRTP
jgi:D-alanyl-D-alanine-carboxypeptidase/D-alanyl-D-alanine-endopeptidase